MLKRLIDWIYLTLKDLQYGTLVITITVHQNEITAVEKQVSIKEKIKLDKKPLRGA